MDSWSWCHRDLGRYATAADIAPTLQAVLDRWHDITPELEKLATAIEEGSADTHPFEQAEISSPLPRAFQWADGSAYVNHVELVRRARGAELPESFWTDPLMYQGGSDSFLGPRDPIRFPEEAVPAWGIDFEAEIAVITGDVPMGVTPEEARGMIRLVMLVNDVSLRGLISGGARQRFWLLSGKAVVRLLTGRGDARTSSATLSMAGACTCRCSFPTTNGLSAGPKPART